MASNAAVVEDWQPGERPPNDTERPAANEQKPEQPTTDLNEQPGEQNTATPNEQEAKQNTTSQDAAAQQAVWQLSIAQGLHQGALVALHEGELIVVGSDDDCDIQLFDAGVAARHLALIMRDAVVTVRALDDAIAINGKPAVPGIQKALDAGDKIGIADGSVQLLLACGATEDAPVPEQEENNAGERVSATPPKSDKRLLRRLLIPAFVLLMVAVLTLTLLGGYTQQSPHGEVDTQALQAKLAELKLHDDIRIEKAERGVTLRGTLESESLARLSDALRAKNMRVRLAIGSAEQLLEQVRDVFRTNGYGAKLQYLGAGNVQVVNLDGGNKAVKKIAEYVKQDVSDLRTLSFAPFEQADSAGEPQLYIPPSGKRLTTIIDGDTAYVATEDGARYFTGSALPGGYHIRRITAKGVQVDKDGAITWLRF